MNDPAGAQYPNEPGEHQIVTSMTPSTAPPTPTSTAGPRVHPPILTRAPGVQPRPGTEYLVILPTNPRQPGVQTITGYRPIQAFNPQGMIRPILLPNNASQIIRAQASSSGVMPNLPTSQPSITTMANIPNRHMPIPISAAGPRGPITLANGPIMPNQLQRPSMAPRANILQSPGMMRNFAQQGIGVHSIIPNSQQQLGRSSPMTGTTPTIIQHSSTSTPPATTPSQMTPDDALAKGTSFFTHLLTNSNIQSKKTTLQSLIQALIDGNISSEQFATDLQTELNSSKPQTQLVPFLDLLLPNLRQSMIANQTSLPGIRPPLKPSIITSRLSDDFTGASTSTDNQVQSGANLSAIKKKKILPPGQKTPYAIKKEAREAKKREKEASQATTTPLSDKIEAIKEAEKIKPDKKRQDKQKKQLESLSSALRDDDDVNDVAAMGGVNLAEESQKIMASSADLVGTQIRSCKDEPFLDIDVLTARISKITQKFDLADPSTDVVTLISHATQERLKTMVERLGVMADHRSENLKYNPRYEVSNDVKGQVKFLAELDRIERRRNEEQEREQMLRIAKSRSKVEDPEQQKLRQKAKDMQRAEQEEVRQREANETALLAIGPRKKIKTSLGTSESSYSQSMSLADIKPNIDFRSDTVKKIRRVNMRDLQALLELDRTHIDRLMKLLVQ